MSQDFANMWSNPQYTNVNNTGMQPLNMAFNVGAPQNIGTGNTFGFSAPQATANGQFQLGQQPQNSGFTGFSDPQVVPSLQSDFMTSQVGAGYNQGVTDNWFTGGGSDGQGSFGLLGDYGNDFLSLFGGQGNGADISSGVTGSQLASNNATANDWGWGDTVNADNTVTKGKGAGYLDAGAALMDAFFGFQNMNMAKDQLALQQDTFAFNKENILQDRADKKQFNQDVGAAIVS